MPISVPCACGRVFEAPESLVGGLARCPACGRESVVPKPGSPEVMVIGEEERPARTSVAANVSLVLGLCFFLGFLTGVPAILVGGYALSKIGRSGGRLRGRGRAIVGIVLGIGACVLTVALLMPAVRAANEAARRAQCTGHLKQIVMAIHNYQAAYGTLPPAAIVGKAGKPLLSWRVAILPWMEQGDLYNKFHLDEPWDSPHNLALLDARPLSYACPSHPSLARGETGYQAVVGADAAFTPDFKPLRFEDITDGLAQTIIAGESRHAVPWTKPDDFPLDLASFDCGFGSFHGTHFHGFNVMMGSGSIRFLKADIDAKTLRAMLTRAGGEPIEE